MVGGARCFHQPNKRREKKVEDQANKNQHKRKDQKGLRLRKDPMDGSIDGWMDVWMDREEERAGGRGDGGTVGGEEQVKRRRKVIVVTRFVFFHNPTDPWNEVKATL